ncbi:MAG TPA: hypothetical protein VKU00_27145 [Chthonomonadaceae bacterium]|nr:hypothetical protein [Chthonomonadaceae bacterium]
MNPVTELHQQAMVLAEQAFVARRQKQLSNAREFARQAFLLERQAAEQAQTEPSRSVLYRSAATLARDCGEYREAERLIATALAGTPPDSIADELRVLLEEVYALMGREGTS